ncbi:Type II restriction enzyme, methylase subunit YeeA [Rubellimicrobium mesophilum DSM 19309]|uniref:site-specific DNA-methyltransferase (adenine-specific) n=1 Tax=Rubellimicrobium mesophilum DSM 19309 TaxID=442562 RepID=A0A017HNJ1_9RHOB|nr:DNA methyltransferase [Rubellimicrobium mesophilum]EYD75936.1 Type II restriction enzyme, methylase subunit YeeA [Rubellimicrobium mesophilum DSM 19309]
MNAVEIEEAVSALAERPFDPDEFPFAFLEAFGNKETTLKKLRSGTSNKSDLKGVLQTNNIHIAVCAPGEVTSTLGALKASPATSRAKAKFVLATDGQDLEAEDLASGETVACAYRDFPDHFGFFLPLAGITTVRQIRENAFDIKATGRLNRLYIELLKDNPAWGTAARRPDMNHFMARLIFSFFAEDTDIFSGTNLFTQTIETFSAKDSSNTHEVIGEIFRAMNTKIEHRSTANLPRWVNDFPYVNGGLFSGSTEVPRFSKIARSYLLHIANLDWKKINPDIFGSMIQAVADDEERGALGMHYTSVPNILKVLNPLFLDDLREKLEEAGDNSRKLLNLRNRMARIRVFDPACGSGNFLVIAYKQMRALEAEINRRRGETDRRTEIPLTNFRGIELRDFPAEIARLALIIAEYQCDVLYRGQKEALAEFLPLDAQNWITCGNALRLDWLSICPPTGTAVKHHAEDLFHTPLDQAQIDFENEGGETFICGNPPFKGARKQTKSQKEDMERVFKGGHEYKDCDYVVAWYIKASEYSNVCPSDFAFVSTNSIARGEQVQHLWSRLYEAGDSIFFCHTQFKWANNASDNAGVWCVIIGVTRRRGRQRAIFSEDTKREVLQISPYLIPGAEEFIKKSDWPLASDLPKLVSGNMARDDGGLIMDEDEKRSLLSAYPQASRIIRPLIGTTEVRQGSRRWCLWIEDSDYEEAMQIPIVRDRIQHVRTFRESSKAKTTQGYARWPYKFAQKCHLNQRSIVVPKNTMDGIPYITPIYVGEETVTTDLAFVAYTEEIWVLSVLSSTLHRVWSEAISGGLGSGVRYSSQITYNSFPLPALTTGQKLSLKCCAEDILSAREAHFPATIADLYDPEGMPANLHEAHERNDEVLERIYIGRTFKNDTERLEKLFELYTKMTTGQGTPKKRKAEASA